MSCLCLSVFLFQSQQFHIMFSSSFGGAFIMNSLQLFLSSPDLSLLKFLLYPQKVLGSGLIFFTLLSFGGNSLLGQPLQSLQLLALLHLSPTLRVRHLRVCNL
ncbi:hypothetical protein PF010_g27972 [Phytophthora fragariae]|uniref:Uncharacterized protein n=1 Tax=Phytophthora fragariae TaxID=53985 RepID=A0A6G0JSX5_9STRA|nr:hypothetical protein PF010_g27972 [Phytophthora fragariae]